MHNNQIFDIVCTAKNLPLVIDTAMTLFDYKTMFTREKCRVTPAYQVSPGNKYYAIAQGKMAPGGAYPHGIPATTPWTDLPFDYDADKIADKIIAWGIKTLNVDPENKDRDGCPFMTIRVRSMRSLLLSVPENHGLTGEDAPILVFSVSKNWSEID